MDSSLQTDHPQPFTQFLIAARRGKLLVELSQEMQNLITAVVDTGRSGSLTLKLAVTPTEDGGCMIISDDVVCRPPKPATKPSMFFVGDGGSLHRRPPGQEELPLRQVPAPDTEENQAI